MLFLKGKYGEAKVFTDTVDKESINQVVTLLDQPMSERCQIRMMPDIHAGAGCTIGTTMTIKDSVIPNLVGVDIGCGVNVIKLKNKDINFKELDDLIREKIPSGFNKRSTKHSLCNNINLKELRCYKNVDIENAYNSLGTLGGGNHFIEVDKGDNNLYLVIHTGSRHLGLEVANYYQNLAYEKLKGTDKETIKHKKDEIINKLKAENKLVYIEEELKKIETSKEISIPKDLAYCEGQLFLDYIHDMKIVQEFAVLNRQAIADEIVRGLNLEVEEEFTTIHNYIDTDNMILRKGAVSAQKGEKLIIPINMRDGSLICVGKGEPDWNYSAPHGAGRILSRSQARKNINLEDFRDSMKDIYTTSVSLNTIDEAPMAYKNIDDIVNNIGPTVDIIETIKPIYNFKAEEEIQKRGKVKERELINR